MMGERASLRTHTLKGTAFTGCGKTTVVEGYGLKAVPFINLAFPVARKAVCIRSIDGMAEPVPFKNDVLRPASFVG